MKKRKHPKRKHMPPNQVPQTALATPVLAPKPPYLKIVIAVFIIAILSFAIFFGLRFFQKSPEQASFQPTPYPSPQGDPRALDTCALTKEGNPLVDQLSNQLGVIHGSLRGVIKELQRDQIRGSFIFKLRSEDGTQEYKFNILENENLIIDTRQNKVASASALRNEQLISASFVCNQETNLLEFNKLSILGTSPQSTGSGLPSR